MAWIILEGADDPETCSIVLDFIEGSEAEVVVENPVTNKVFETEQDATEWASENVALEWTVCQVTS